MNGYSGYSPKKEKVNSCSPANPVICGMEFSLVELFFLRTLCFNRIQELKETQTLHGENSVIGSRMQEMLDYYEPLHARFDSEIERRSTKRAF